MPNEPEIRDERFDYDEQFECLPDIDEHKEFSSIILANQDTVNNLDVTIVEAAEHNYFNQNKSN